MLGELAAVPAKRTRHLGDNGVIMWAEKRPDALTPWGDTPVYKVIAWYFSTPLSGRTILVAE